MSKVAVKKNVEKIASQSTVLTDIKHYGRQIWLAGLGAYAKAGQEGADYLKELVKAGESVEKQGKKLVTEQVEAANSQIDEVKGNVISVKDKLESRFDKIEKAFDDRVAIALNRVGIPSRQDVEALSAKLDVLNELLASVTKTK
ncbi:phasin family protein [Pseudomonas sp. LS44]|uniref:phasin family protein n=1 Tax=Pseudomonas sp. LS44 TaxID=1357074 RepID=UPI00215AE2B4|nr:phasin family protein [Pseudomonas sp. LS44]UVE18243.1 phasin family protein [Pseudomonas sp. LS44]